MASRQVKVEIPRKRAGQSPTYSLVSSPIGPVPKPKENAKGTRRGVEIFTESLNRMCTFEARKMSKSIEGEAPPCRSRSVGDYWRCARTKASPRLASHGWQNARHKVWSKTNSTFVDGNTKDVGRSTMTAGTTRFRRALYAHRQDCS